MLQSMGHKESDVAEQLNDNNQSDDNSPVGEGREACQTL